ncbi:MAG: Mov34/MPN/PAD-1 family protein [Peptococcaceae bacterium]|nr:Mov34/MPN/PAD-1 family protein [Peptococcaceae bacterium]
MIYIAKSALGRIEAEVLCSMGIETGGILVGVLLKTGDILITHATSPGPKAIKARNFFKKDFNYTVQVFNVLYLKYSVDYLGEWHKHPYDCIRYSQKDKESMLEISVVNTRPCFFIIVSDSFSLANSKCFLKIYGVEKESLRITEYSWEETEEPEKLAMERGIQF